MSTLLVIEASSVRASVCLIKDKKILAEATNLQQKKHSEMLNQMVSEVLDSAKISLLEITLIAVSNGPGSFTGLRVALGAAQTYAYCLKLPIFLMSSLQVLALEYAEKKKEFCAAKSSVEKCRVVTLLNAFKNMLFFAVYEFSQSQEDRLAFNLVEILSPQTLTLEQFKTFASSLEIGDEYHYVFIGDGIRAYDAFFKSSEINRLGLNIDNSPEFCVPTASTLGMAYYKFEKLGKTLDWKSISPVYLKDSEAEENLRKGLLKSTAKL